jgi:hypothetical protein
LSRIVWQSSGRRRLLRLKGRRHAIHDGDERSQTRSRVDSADGERYVFSKPEGRKRRLWTSRFRYMDKFGEVVLLVEVEEVARRRRIEIVSEMREPGLLAVRQTRE